MIGFNTSDDANDNINDSNDKVIPIIASTIMLMEITKKMIMTLIIWIILKVMIIGRIITTILIMIIRIITMLQTMMIDQEQPNSKK